MSPTTLNGGIDTSACSAIFGVRSSGDNGAGSSATANSTAESPLAAHSPAQTQENEQAPRKPMLRQASFVVTQPAPLGSAPSRPKPAAVKAAPTKTALPKPATQPEDSALLGDALLREIGAAAKAERKGGAGAQ